MKKLIVSSVVCAVFASLTYIGWAQDAPKMKVEQPVKKILADLSKERVEQPLKARQADAKKDQVEQPVKKSIRRMNPDRRKRAVELPIKHALLDGILKRQDEEDRPTKDREVPAVDKIKPIATWVGRKSKIEDNSFYSIKTTKEWENLWKRHAGDESKSPTVDFEKHIVIAAFTAKGRHTFGLFREVTVDDESVNVICTFGEAGTEEHECDDDCNSTPYVMVVLKRTDKAVRIYFRPHTKTSREPEPRLMKEFSYIAPGDLDWHRSFNRAVAAAQKSGRPVLLFQILGHLDEPFC